MMPALLAYVEITSTGFSKLELLYRPHLRGLLDTLGQSLKDERMSRESVLSMWNRIAVMKSLVQARDEIRDDRKPTMTRQTSRGRSFTEED